MSQMHVSSIKLGNGDSRMNETSISLNLSLIHNVMGEI